MKISVAILGIKHLDIKFGEMYGQLRRYRLGGLLCQK